MNIITIILLIFGLVILWLANKTLPDPDSSQNKILYYWTTEEKQEFEEMQTQKENGEWLVGLGIALLILSIISSFIKQ